MKNKKLNLGNLISGLTVFALTKFSPEIIKNFQYEYITIEGGSENSTAYHEELKVIKPWNAQEIKFPLNYRFLNFIKQMDKGTQFFFHPVYFDAHRIFHALYTFQSDRHLIGGDSHTYHTVDIETKFTYQELPGEYKPQEHHVHELFYLIPPKAQPESLIAKGGAILSKISPKSYNHNKYEESPILNDLYSK